MKRLNWQVRLGLGLVLLSTLVYLIHFLFFRDVHHILIYLVGDIAFVPIEVLLVTLIIHRLLTQREKRALLEKLNMVIGSFFSEVGTELLTYFSAFDPDSEKIKKELVVEADWSDKEFLDVARRLKSHDYKVRAQDGDPDNLKAFLIERRDFMLRLLENPNLLEHDSFTHLLWAVFHLTEELSHRRSLRELPEKDYEHLSGDIRRAYVLLVSEWLDHMHHLKRSYPYLFSLAIRTNPFDPEASPVIR